MRTLSSMFILSSVAFLSLLPHSASSLLRALSNETVCEDDPEFEKFCGELIKVKDKGGNFKKPCKASNVEGLGTQNCPKTCETCDELAAIPKNKMTELQRLAPGDFLSSPNGKYWFGIDLIGKLFTLT